MNTSELKSLAVQVAIMRRAKARRKELQSILEVLESDLDEIGKKIEDWRDHPTEEDRFLQELMDDYLKSDQQLKVTKYELKLIDKTLYDLHDCEKILLAFLNDLRTTSISHEINNLIGKKAIEYRSILRVIFEIRDVIIVCTRCLRLLLKIRIKIVETEKFNRRGDTYQETQILKKVLLFEIDESKRIFNLLHPEIDALMKELGEVSVHVAKINDNPTDIYFVFPVKFVAQLIRQVQEQKDLQSIWRYLHRIALIFIDLSQDLKARNRSLRLELFQIKEDIISDGGSHL